jgi:hypothetical protein
MFSARLYTQDFTPSHVSFERLHYFRVYPLGWNAHHCGEDPTATRAEKEKVDNVQEGWGCSGAEGGIGIERKEVDCSFVNYVGMICRGWEMVGVFSFIVLWGSQ